MAMDAPLDNLVYVFLLVFTDFLYTFVFPSFFDIDICYMHIKSRRILISFCIFFCYKQYVFVF